MDIGDELVRNDGGYGCGGTLSWATTWTTAFSVYSTVNPPVNPAVFYQAQTSGNLCEITDSVCFRNLSANAYVEANARGVFAPANNNVLVPGVNPINAPIVSITRGGPVSIPPYTMFPVSLLDPRPANEALTSVGAAPGGGFFTPAMYRGAFEPTPVQPWTCGWTASYAFGFTPMFPVVANFCTAGTTSNGCVPSLSGAGTPSATAGSGFTLTATHVEGQKQGLLFYGVSGGQAAPWGAGSSSFLCVKPPNQRLPAQSSGGTAGACNGVLSADWNQYIATHPAALGVPFDGCETVWAQAWFRDPPAPKTTALSNGLVFTVLP